MCESVLVSRVFYKFSIRIKPSVFYIRTFALMEGENMKCEFISMGNEMRGDITEYYSYQTLSMYLNTKCPPAFR